jgi:hypothetical protein
MLFFCTVFVSMITNYTESPLKLIRGLLFLKPARLHSTNRFNTLLKAPSLLDSKRNSLKILALEFVKIISV